MAASTSILQEQARQQRERVEDRCTSEQWLDENEREWYSLDTMVRSRPWATRRDEPFRYPFRDATNEMRAAEGPWLGDDTDPPNRPWTRKEAPSEVLVHARPVSEHPPRCRVLRFTPEFGSEDSFAGARWAALPEGYDLWTVSWQGWSDFDEMIAQLLHRVLSFADGVSTVWFGHSFGAIVAYELLKRFEEHHSPNFPVALMVSGCPAPHLFSASSDLQAKRPWLAGLQVSRDLDRLTPEELAEMRRDFQVVSRSAVHPILVQAALRGGARPGAAARLKEDPGLSPEQRKAVLGDLAVLRGYRADRRAEDRRAIAAPLVAICHDEDDLAEPEAVEAWEAYAPAGAAPCTAREFELLALEEVEDGEILAEQGHGFTLQPVKALLDKIVEVSERRMLVKDIDCLLPDPGPTDGPVPSEIDCVVVGAGIAGVMQAKALAETGRSVVVFERYRTIGGIWMYYANNFSRVNSSEPAYRIVNQQGIGSRPNEDHSPRHDILRDIFTVAHRHCYGLFRCNIDVKKVTKRPDKTFDVLVEHLGTGKQHSVHAKVVTFHVNRRIGRRRDVTYPGASLFRGDEVYGYANEVLGLQFWGKRVVVVGAGAFAFENMRTAIEHGAKHVTVLGRRSGTTCPKWIDMIAFLRPLDPMYNTNRNGNIISFECWRRCYEEAGLKTPECWDEGLLKPNNHTVSVSDLAFIAGFHGMVDLRVGEIDSFRPDGHGVALKDGGSLDCDIVIKATGFHLNDEVPAITGYSKIYAFDLLDFNLNYGAEPLLDGGQFGSAKGKAAGGGGGGGPEDEKGQGEFDQAVIMEGMAEAARLQLPDFQLRTNPFGSAYVGGMLKSTYFFKWLVENQEHQRILLEAGGSPTNSAVQMWVSTIGTGTMSTIFRLMSSLGGRGGDGAA